MRPFQRRDAVEPSAQMLAWTARHGGIIRQQALAGGVWCSTFRLHLGDGTSVVAKRYPRDLPGIYRSEADGLRALAGCGWTVPEVLAVDEQGILMQDLGSGHPPAADYWERLGRAWAHLHGRASSACGWASPTYWGVNQLANPRIADHARFYRETRFQPYLAVPHMRQALGALWGDVQWMVAHLEDWVAPGSLPVLCHGDLWYGNLLVGPGGLPAVVDPAIHVGLAEADIAHATAYGGFDDRCFDAYRECRHLEPGWRIRCLPYEALHHLACIRDHIDAMDDLRATLARLRRHG